MRIENDVETVDLLCRKAEQADRHIVVNYEPQGRELGVGQLGLCRNITKNERV